MSETANQFRVDLHTHSIISHDGGITSEQYEWILDRGILDYIAITDHNEIGFAKVMQKQLGERIIIGEEITTQEGEILGLFLQETIPGGLSLEETVASIKHQKGLVYIPHPFEHVRKGIQQEHLDSIQKDIDLIEVFNGRAVFRAKAEKARQYAKAHSIPGAASSDGHCRRGIGNTYTMIDREANVATLVDAIREGMCKKKLAPLYTILCPKINRVRNRLLLTNYS